MRGLRAQCLWLVLTLTVPHSAPAASPDGADKLHVAAAISLREALLAMNENLQAELDLTIECSFGSSGQLLEQIRNGAPYDVYLAAARAPLDLLARENLIVDGSLTVIAGNRLVLLAPASSTEFPKSFADLAGPAVRRVAVGEPETVPAGYYARQALEKLGVWSELQDRLVYGKNVRQVLDYVERGEVDAGIVYATDARASGDKVRCCATADAGWHDPIVYCGAVLQRSSSPDRARAFLAYFDRPEGREVLHSLGFLGAADGSTPEDGVQTAPAASPAPSPAGRAP